MKIKYIKLTIKIRYHFCPATQKPWSGKIKREIGSIKFPEQNAVNIYVISKSDRTIVDRR